MSNPGDIDRRTVLQLLAASGTTLGGAGAVSGGKSGSRGPSKEESETEPLPDVETTELRKKTARQEVESAASTASVERMRAFLSSNHDSRINGNALSGVRIAGDELRDHVRLSVPIQPRHGDNHLEVRIFDDGVTAQALVDGAAYFTGPQTVADQSALGAEGAVVPASEWERGGSSGEGLQTQGFDRACLAQGTFDAGGPACTFISGVAAVGSGILLLIPEPGSTATGAVALSLILGGSCNIANALEDGLNLNCEITEIGVCVSIPSPLSPTGVYAYPADCV